MRRNCKSSSTEQPSPSSPSDGAFSAANFPADLEDVFVYKMTAVGFEPTRFSPPELESGALDRSAKLSVEIFGEEKPPPPVL